MKEPVPHICICCQYYEPNNCVLDGKGIGYLECQEKNKCRGFRLHENYKRGGKWYNDRPDKAVKQEQKLLTFDEANICEDGWYWIEYQTPNTTSGVYYLRCHAIERDSFDFDQLDCYFRMIKDGYGKYWRCWTARPTDEQRQAVKWDD